MAASVKSSLMVPLVTRASMRRGTTHRPTLLTCPLRHSSRAASLAGAGMLCGTGAIAWPSAGRSLVSAASSPYVRGERAFDALVQFLGGQPAVAGGHPKQLDDPVPVLVRCPQPVCWRHVLVAAPGRRYVAHHGQTLRPGAAAVLPAATKRRIRRSTRFTRCRLPHDALGNARLPCHADLRVHPELSSGIRHVVMS